MAIALLTTTGWGAAHAACLHAAAGYADGCANAPAKGAFQQATFGTFARQSGQKWVSGHPQPWDVAGWDYPVGYSKVTAPGMYPLVKPDRAKSGGVGSGANLPYAGSKDGCFYTATGNPQIPGAPAILCYGTLPANGAGAYAGKVVISGINFAADSLGRCVQLNIQIDGGQSVYVVNNNFKKGAACYLPGVAASDSLVRFASTTSNLFLYNNILNDNAPFGPANAVDQAHPVYAGTTGTVDAEYNAFLHNAARVFSGDGRSGWTFKYNYIDGMAISPTAPHGEVMGTFPNDDWATIAYQDAEFNTAVWGADSHGGGGSINAALFLAGGGNGQTLTLGTVSNNTLVSNLEYGGMPSSGKVIFAVQMPYITTLNVSNNYADPSGSYMCMSSDGLEINISGYIDDGMGPGGAYDGVPGNVMHVTIRAGKNFFSTGAQIFSKAVGAAFPGTQTIVGAAGYNCNGAVVTGSVSSLLVQNPYETYCLSGPPTAVALFTGAQTQAQVANVSINGNVNLLDGSSITQGATATWNGACNGRAKSS